MGPIEAFWHFCPLFQETDRLLGQQYTEADPSYYNKVGHL